MEGYRRAFAEHGATLDEDLIVTGDFTYAVGYDVALDLLRRRPVPTAILAQNDDMAVAALGAARALGLSVPGDISIAGFDDSEVSRTTWPQLTTVRQPVSAMAWDATDRLIGKLDATDNTAPLSSAITMTMPFWSELLPRRRARPGQSTRAFSNQTESSGAARSETALGDVSGARQGIAGRARAISSRACAANHPPAAGATTARSGSVGPPVPR
jgi:hypothetical protein